VLLEYRLAREIAVFMALEGVFGTAEAARRRQLIPRNQAFVGSSKGGRRPHELTGVKDPAGRQSRGRQCCGVALRSSSFGGNPLLSWN
jgi:hypothetical protein